MRRCWSPEAESGLRMSAWSNRVTFSPRFTRDHAVERPAMPAPMTAILMRDVLPDMELGRAWSQRAQAALDEAREIADQDAVDEEQDSGRRQRLDVTEGVG